MILGSLCTEAFTLADVDRQCTILVVEMQLVGLTVPELLLPTFVNHGCQFLPLGIL